MKKDFDVAAGPDRFDNQGKRSSWFQPLRLNKRSYLLVIALFTMAGIAGGYAYYALVGCKTGGCAITSSPTLSIIWGGLMGYLIPDIFAKQKQ